VVLNGGIISRNQGAKNVVEQRTDRYVVNLALKVAVGPLLDDGAVVDLLITAHRGFVLNCRRFALEIELHLAHPE
jgi:hypothetical protein